MFYNIERILFIVSSMSQDQPTSPSDLCIHNVCLSTVLYILILFQDLISVLLIQYIKQKAWLVITDVICFYYVFVLTETDRKTYYNNTHVASQIKNTQQNLIKMFDEIGEEIFIYNLLYI